MKFIEKLIYYLFPDLMVSATPWREIWTSQKRDHFAKKSSVILFVISLVYIGHYYFFDLKLGLQPPSLWIKFRFGMAAVCILCSIFYLLPKLYRNNYYKLPAIFALGLVCYTQARVSVWYPEAPYLFAVVFTYLASVLLDTSALKSLFFAGAMYMIQVSSFSEAGVPESMIFSTGVVLMAMTLFSRIGYLAEIKYFIANMENLESQKKIIELSMEVASQIRAFLPREISRRMNACVNERRMSVVQAADEILRPQKKEVSCLFSDIRGFTQGSRDLDNYVNNSLFPNIKACTEVVDELGGIPRKIGDLIFAYFDSEGVEVSALSSVVAAMRISKLNKQFNSANGSTVIERYLLVSTGHAVVGNLGGFDASIEITAIGSPVNYLSRVDNITKDESVKKNINREDIIMDARTYELIMKLVPGIDVKTIDLEKLNVKIRDFESVTKIYTLSCTEKNYNLIMSLFEYVENTARGAA